MGLATRLVAWAEETIEETLTFYRCPDSTTNTSRAPTCWSASTRRSGAGPTSSESSPTPPHAAASSERLPSKPTRTGSKHTATSTWTTSKSTKKPSSAKPPSPKPLQNLTHTILGGPKRCLVASPYEADTRPDSEDRGRLTAPRQA